MDVNKFRGTGVAIVTPFRTDNSIDFNALDKLIDHLLSNGVDYLVVLGTTGESVTLLEEEKKAVINFVKEKASGKVPIVVGCGGNNTQQILNHIHEMDFEGIDAILSVAPYYNKPTQEGLYQHYETIANESPVPVILYNVPGRTGSNILPGTALSLAGHKNIIAIKEASGNLNQVMQIMNDRPSDFLVISGEDSLTLAILGIGGDGVISVAANAFPESFSKMVENGLKQQFDAARTHHYQLFKMMGLLFEEGNPAGVKTALEALKITNRNVRLPLIKGSEELKTKIEEEIKIMRP